MKTTLKLVIVAGLILSGRLLHAQGLTVLHSFTGPPFDGAYSHAGLVQGSDGSFYGTTTYGGADDGGLVFKIDSTGTLGTLHSFTGAYPFAALIQASDGFFYGTTETGGANSKGSVFKISSAGVFTNLHSFNGTDGSTLFGSLVEGTDGNFYGTTFSGGANDTGTVFKMTPSGTVTTLHSFSASSSGGPSAGLVQASDGLFYGTTESGGANQKGSIFKITSAGTFTQIHSFDGSDGNQPRAPLLQASDGNFYGTTYYGGSHGGGVIFEVDAAGNFNALVNLVHSAGPTVGLIELADGRLYGAISGSGRFGRGAVFKVNPSNGNYTRLFSFSGPDGWEPDGGLVQGTDGLLYGTTAIGGVESRGVVYSLCTPMPSPTITAEACIPPNTPGLTATVDAVGGDTYNWIVTGGTLDSGQGTNSITFTSGPPGTLVTVSVDESNGTCTGSEALTAEVDFADVPPSDPFYSYICTIGRDAITAGCGNGDYCRNGPVTRAQMAVFLLKAEHGSEYVPPTCTGIFPDVLCPSLYANWIEELSLEGITGGCGNGNYCPGNAVTRRQMAVFLLKASQGSTYVPPAAVGIFGDVPAGDTFAPWIEDLYNRLITGGCQPSPLLYCPDNPNTRGQMAVFLSKMFGL